MQIQLKKVVIFSIVISTVFSCVPTRQFNDIQEKNRKLLTEKDLLKLENQRFSVENKELTSELKSLEGEIKEIEKKHRDKIEECDMLMKDFNRVNRQYIDLQKAQEELIRGNDKETRRLLKQLQVTQESLQEKGDELRELEVSLSSKKQNLEELLFELDQRNARLIELEKILQKKDSVVLTLKDKVSSALMGFENDGLTVTLKNGKVYVSLEEKLLFGTGSTIVSPSGVNALKKLGQVLERNTDINIMIEGHTDDVPYKTDSGPIKDNWDLSVKRATAVVRILLDNSSINPKRLIASGRGEFMPVDQVKTTEARRKNRRTEIILTPKLDELFRILENN
ncbi:MAG: OmpA family protein [Bacteroidetes bacterium]|nr:OmpA family protein [Bacteroidota bacterium]